MWKNFESRKVMYTYQNSVAYSLKEYTSINFWKGSFLYLNLWIMLLKDSGYRNWSFVIVNPDHLYFINHPFTIFGLLDSPWEYKLL